MFDDAGLIVSLPARELADVSLPGSLFTCADFADIPVSDDLRLAVRLIGAACSARGITMTLVARPEIFIGSSTTSWLKKQIGDVRHHLCISDGLAIRVMPEMQNHMFLYRLGIRENAEAFRRLAHRAPGFLAGLASQVNTAFRFEVADSFIRPPSQLIQSLEDMEPESAPEPLVFHSDVEWIMSRGVTAIDPGRSIARVTYMPLTETALSDQTFCNVVAALVAEAYFDPSACVLLRLPVLPALTASLSNRLTAAVIPLRYSKPQLPRVPSPGVFFLPGDVTTPMLQSFQVPVTLLMHDSFDFWRHSEAFYRHFSHIRIFAPLVRRGARVALLNLLSAALGRTPEVHWLRPEKIGFP